MPRGRGRLVTVLSIAVLLLLVPVGVVADDGTPDIPGPQKPKLGPGVVDLLQPAKRMLSGASWLMAEGIDPRLWLDRPGWSSLTRLNWEELGGGFLGGAGAPPSQAGPGGLVPFRDPAPAFSRDILVTRDFSQFPLQTEPHLAVNPKDPDHLILGTIDYNFPNNSVYVSLDGGVTWEGPEQLRFLRDDDISAGDPVVGFDRDGNAYFISISLGTEEYSLGPLVAFAAVSSIILAASDDGGFTWGEPVSTARSEVTSELELDQTGRVRGELTFSFLDKPWMAIGPDPDNPEQDNIYVTYTDFVLRYEVFYIGELPFTGLPQMETTIRMVTSEDKGATWSEPIAVSPTMLTVFGDVPGGPGVPGQALGTKRAVQGSQPKVAPDGTLYVTWLDTTDDDSMKGLGEIYVARSDDGGETFSKEERAAVFNEVAFRPRNAFFRFWGSSFPQIAVGLEGEVYVAYGARPPDGDKQSDDADIYLTRSLDRGESWSPRPVRLNQDETSRVQFFPSIDVGPDGTIHAMWGDMRDDPQEIRYHIYYTRSQDQGETWGFVNEELGISTPDTRATDFPSNSLKGFTSGLFLGDYFSIAATEKDVYMVWADTRLGEFGGVNQKIGFTRQQAVPSPEIFLSPPAGSGGRDVTIQGFGFQPAIDVFIQVGGAIVSSERTNDQGRFTTSLFMPLTGEGAHDVNVFDESGNRAGASFFTEFGFDTVQKLQQNLQDGLDSLRLSLAPEGVTDDTAHATLQEQIAALQQLIEAQGQAVAEAGDSREGISVAVALLLGLGAALIGGLATGGLVAAVVARRR